MGVLGGCCWWTWRTCPSSDPATGPHIFMLLSGCLHSLHLSLPRPPLHPRSLLDRNSLLCGRLWAPWTVCFPCSQGSRFGASTPSSSFLLFQSPLHGASCSSLTPIARIPRCAPEGTGFGSYSGMTRPADQTTHHLKESSLVTVPRRRERPSPCRTTPQALGVNQEAEEMSDSRAQSLCWAFQPGTPGQGRASDWLV